MISLIVLISGKQGSGKSTTAAALQRLIKDQYKAESTICKFAAPIYDIHDTILDRMETLTGMKRVAKDGKLLQLLGTEWGRHSFGEDIWAKMVKAWIYNKDDYYKSLGYLHTFIIDDCRFKNEFDIFPEALRVRLEAPAVVRKERAEGWRDNLTHQSEIDLDAYAEAGLFDLYIDTADEMSSPEHCATLILAQLKKRVWNEKR